MKANCLVAVAVTCSLIVSYLPQVQPTSIRIAASWDTGVTGTLQHHLCTSGLLESNTELVLSSGVHTINSSESCVLRDLHNISITSLGVARVVCSSKPQGHNFVILNVTNLVLENVEIEGCGHVLPTTLPFYVNNTFCYISILQKTVFLLSHITNLSISNVVFMRSFGFSIIAVNLRGNTELINVTIVDTDNYRQAGCYGNETDMSCSGSGAVFVYSDYAIDGSTLDDISFTITHSNITNNKNYVPDNLFIPIFINIRSNFEAEDILLTGATGLAFYLGQRSYNVDVNIISSTISNNEGYGGAMVFVLYNSIRENHIDISGCTMESNKGYRLARGGAIIALIISYLSHLPLFPEYPPDIFELFFIHETSFIRNSAPIGGSMYFYVSPQNLSDYSVTFDNVTFRENQAGVASALEFNTRQATFVQKDIHILMKDVIATGNIFPSSGITSSSNVENSGAFVFSRVFNITIIGSNHTHKSVFSSNSPGAFLVLGGNFYLKGHVEFIENRALRGGALSMYDYALLFFHEGAKVNFTKNSASEVGGAIYANSLGTGTAPTCVFQVIGPSRISNSMEVSTLKLELRFRNNTAVEGGNSIYVHPLYSCAYLPESSLIDRSVYYNASIVYNSIFTFESSVSNGLRELSSTPERVCYCSDGDVKSSSQECKLATNLTVSVFPGQLFLVPAFPADFNYNPVSSIVFAELDSKVHTLGNGQDTQQLDGIHCTLMEFTLFGAEKTNTSLSLYTRIAGNRLTMDLYLKECPPGFLLVGAEGKQACICDPYVMDVVRSMCNFTYYTISRRPNLWLGVNEHPNASGVVYVETCPFGFCIANASFVDLMVEDQFCTEGRTGILCGACKGNLSVVFGSPYCMKCSNFWLFTILLYAVAGIMMVTILFLLHLTVAHGTINAIIFYANIVSVNSNILFPTSRGFLFIWISIMNLELGFPLCFYDRMNEAAKAGLQSIFPMYLLLICIFIIILSENSRRVAKLTSAHGLQVLATTVYLSFSKMLRYVIDILTFSTLRSQESTHSIWFYDGNLDYFTSNHGIIAIIPALVTLIFIIVYSVAMIFIKQIEQRSTKLKPFMDAYAGPFKDKYRFWFGLRLLVLAAMCLTYAVVGTDDPVLALAIQLLFLFLFMLLQAYVKPFRNPFINATDLFFMINFFVLILYIIRAYQYSIEARDSKELIIVVMVFLSMAFAHFALIIISHILRALYRISTIRTKTKPLVKYLKNLSMSIIFQKMRELVRVRKTDVQQATSSVKLTSMNSVTRENSVFTNEPATVSSTEISLDNAINSDTIEKMLSRKVTFSHFRESIIES